MYNVLQYLNYWVIGPFEIFNDGGTGNGDDQYITLFALFAQCFQ